MLTSMVHVLHVLRSYIVSMSRKKLLQKSAISTCTWYWSRALLLLSHRHTISLPITLPALVDLLLTSLVGITRDLARVASVL